MAYKYVYVISYMCAARERALMGVLTGLAVWTAVLFAAQQVSLDFGPIGNAIVWAASVSGGVFALYRMWFKPVINRVVDWFTTQGEIHAGIAADITHIRKSVDDHETRLSSMEHVIFPPIAGGEGPDHQEAFYLTDEQVRAARERIMRRMRGERGEQ